MLPVSESAACWSCTAFEADLLTRPTRTWNVMGDRPRWCGTKGVHYFSIFSVCSFLDQLSQASLKGLNWTCYRHRSGMICKKLEWSEKEGYAITSFLSCMGGRKMHWTLHCPLCWLPGSCNNDQVCLHDYIAGGGAVTAHPEPGHRMA